eukprot:GCRY01002903.1.p1 GENE.GCRY01002903.1~~GCRY01002903.1.p1  ORF type:complete len:430 (-),score=44.77 GCRY01002903.1:78-1367(-)
MSSFFPHEEVEFVAEGENDRAFFVVMHEPSKEAFISALHPCGALYEKGVSGGTAQEHHSNMVQAFERRGVKVTKVRDILESSDYNVLVDLAAQFLCYQFVDGDGSPGNLTALSEKERFFFSQEYKTQNLNYLTKPELVDVILQRPTVVLKKAEKNTPLLTLYTKFNPVGNLVFTRDQQITTAKGVIIGRLAPAQRAPENAIMKTVFQQAGIAVIGEVDGPTATLEGGDFIPVSKDLCLIGEGLRTNMEACEQLMTKDLFGTRRVAVVRDFFDKDQDRMHLDTVFNVVDGERAVILETIVGAESPLRRLVTEFVRDDNGKYSIARKDIEFSEYIKAEGFSLIPISHEEQLQYMINFVNVGNTAGLHAQGYIIAVHPKLGERLKEHGYKGDVEYVEFAGIKALYGACHCATQVFRLKNTSASALREVYLNQ